MNETFSMNTNFHCGTKTFHVQTEYYKSSGKVVTNIFFQGNIVKRIERLPATADIYQEIKKQHEQVLHKLQEALEKQKSKTEVHTCREETFNQKASYEHGERFMKHRNKSGEDIIRKLVTKKPGKELVSKIVEKRPGEEILKKVIEKRPGEKALKKLIEKKPGKGLFNKLLEKRPGESIAKSIIEKRPGERAVKKLIEKKPGKELFEKIKEEKPGKDFFENFIDLLKH
ncbi:hypothetical protein [Desulfurobacterium sp.]